MEGYFDYFGLKISKNVKYYVSRLSEFEKNFRQISQCVGTTPGLDPWSEGVIPRRFKRKKNFVTDTRTHELMEGWTDVSVEIVI